MHARDFHFKFPRGEKLLTRCVDDVLMRQWDPIGVNGVPQARDEYDNYVSGVVRLIFERADAAAIAAHLRAIEEEQMGLTPRSMAALLPIGERLVSLSVLLDG
jgi:hypothetical protein